MAMYEVTDPSGHSLEYEAGSPLSALREYCQHIHQGEMRREINFNSEKLIGRGTPIQVRKLNPSNIYRFTDYNYKIFYSNGVWHYCRTG